MNSSQIHFYSELLNPSVANQKKISTLVALIRDARKITGREIETGVLKADATPDQISCWLGAIGYLIFLEQVGKCLGSQKDHVVHCLKHFQRYHSLDEPKMYAIYALRCSLMHDYGLINIPPKKKELLTHHFSLTISETDAVIFKKQWDGELSTITSDNETVVDIKRIAEIAESIFRNLSQNNISYTETSTDSQRLFFSIK